MGNQDEIQPREEELEDDLDEGGGQDESDPELDEEMDDDASGEGAEDDADADGGEDDGDGEAEPDPEEDAKAQALKEEEELLGGAKFVKLESGEVISKKAFLKRLKEQKEKFSKEIAERENRLKPYEEKKADIEFFIKNREDIQANIDFVGRLRPALVQNPWLQSILRPLMEGKQVDWQALTNHLKPFMAPFWDGIEIIDPDPSELANKQIQELKARIDQAEKARLEEQNRAQEQVRVAARSKEFASQEAEIWKSYPEFKSKLNRKILLSNALAEQTQLPEGQTVNLTELGHKIFGEMRREAKAKLIAKAKLRKKAFQAGGEGGRRLPHTPVPGSSSDGQPKELRDLVRDRVESLVPGPLED